MQDPNSKNLVKVEMEKTVQEKTIPKRKEFHVLHKMKGNSSGWSVLAKEEWEIKVPLYSRAQEMVTLRVHSR